MEGTIWQVIINTSISFISLFIISKLMGKKQIAQLEFVDYVIGISIGSIAAQMTVDLETPVYYFIIGMALFFVFDLIITFLGRKTLFLKKIFK
ncbi:MAG: hypothetical protein RR400_01730, partial [Clostridia bacterium]